MTITNGQVVFSRTVKTGDYENKKAEVTLAFTLDEGMDAEATVAKVGAMAQDQALQMLGLQGANPKPQPAESAAEKPKRPPAPPKAADKPVEKLKTEADPLAMETTPAKQTAAPAEDTLDDVLSAEAPPITDKDLVSEITVKNAALKNPTAIKQLIWKFAGNQKHAHDIPAAVRAQFVKELKAL